MPTYLMQIVNPASIPAQQIESPNGKYKLLRQSISQALGGTKDVGTWGGGHPFDVEQVRIAPGAANFPYHAHAAQWEMYLFLSGRGQVRGPENTAEIAAGDHVLFKPGEAHQIINTGPDDLVYYVIADQPMADIATYPDAPGKLAIKPPIRCFTMNEASYYEPGD